LVSSCSSSVLRRLTRLERVLLADKSEEVLEGIVWDYFEGGLWGHVRHVFHIQTKKLEVFACTVEEELAFMKNKYEEDGHRFWGKGEELSFLDFLEKFDYAGPKPFAEQREEVVKKLRAEPNEVVS
jgi:hypothetical protein